MASLSTDANGNRTIRFFNADHRRVKICLGKQGKKTAEEIRSKVKTLNGAAIAKIGIDTETAVWLRDLDRPLYDKLAAAGLAPRRDQAKQETLAAFIDSYISKRTDVKPSTRTNLKQVRDNLVDFFGADKPLADVTDGCADDFRRWLGDSEANGGRGLVINTVRRRCGRARQFFRAAVKRRLLASNPFGDMKDISVQSNKKRLYFVSRGEAQRVLGACPDSQWRLLFALSRFGGLRCPSEHLLLKWADIDWAHNRMTVWSPKTEQYDGHESRVVPLFPELLPHLQAVWEETPPDTEFVINRYRDVNSNLRTQFERIIIRAGLTPWPKLFQNLRSTRQTELTETFPIHVVCAWLGNSEAVAKEHYLQVTDEHFSAATAANIAGLESGPESGPPTSISGNNQLMESMQNRDLALENAKTPAILESDSNPVGVIFFWLYRRIFGLADSRSVCP